jgi:drug/metabolite transporter (DMT)-like permease
MAWLWWFLGGGIVGCFVMGIFVGGVQNEKLKDAFDEGFIVGKNIQK